MLTTARPAADEFAPYYAGYISRIADDEDVVAVLDAQLGEVLGRLGTIPESRGEHRYAPGKWTIKEIIGHLSDAERIFAYRALRFARGDESPLASFDENAYVPELRAESRTLADLLAEWGNVRRATLALVRHLPADTWQRRGTASGKVMSVRALVYVIAGHVRHHLGVLGERYGA
jgi:hypothetical protein